MKNTKPKVRLWSVLTGLTAILTVAAIVGNIIANQYATTINVALNASTYKIIHGENTGDTEYFKKGFASDEEREAYEAELCATVEAEGAALLKNENNALPLASGAKVSLFGHGSVDLMYGGTGSGSVDTSKAPNLKQALEAQGITINQTLWDLYSSDSMMSKYSRMTPASISDTLEANTQYAVNEAPWSALSSAESSFAEYGDAAIVVLSRSGGEGADLPSGENGTSDNWISGQEGDGNYLALSAEEVELLQNLKALKDNGTFKKIVVLINSSNAIELDFLNPEICGEDYGIDAAMWIGDVGQTGINGVGQLLSGAVTPSGSLVDTYLYDNMANPAMYNFYTQAYPNAAEYNLLTEGADVQGMYSVYQEGIYLGYRYFETRYEDVVMGTAKAGDYNWATTVAYPFGYGDSYTTFAYSNFNVTESDDAFTVTLKVTNTGKTFSGKETVQIYFQSPYTAYDKANGIEKAAAELCGFAKTDVLAPGASEDVTITVPKSELRTYDANNAKTYILDAGDYYFTAAAGAHEAVNNILAAQGKTTADGMDAAGKNAVVSWKLDALDNTTFAIANNTTVTNVADDADLNYWLPGTVTYLTRQDWNTFPINYNKLNLKIADSPKKDQWIAEMRGETYTISDTGAAAEAVPGPKFTASEIGAEQLNNINDPYWDKLVHAITIDEAVGAVIHGGSRSDTLTNIDNPVVIQNEGPTGISAGYTDEATGKTYKFNVNSQTLLGCSFNPELAYQWGLVEGNSCLWVERYDLWGSGLTLNRTPYNGRNYEYISEDPMLTNVIGREVIQGCSDKGIINGPKHMGFNDQEHNRAGISAYMTEQKFRETDLRGFEGALSDAFGMGVMIAFNRIGATNASHHVGMIQKIVRGEWGFKGLISTDMMNNYLYFNAESMVMAGITQVADFAADNSHINLGEGGVDAVWPHISLETVSKDSNLVEQARENLKYQLYIFANSAILNISTQRVNTWWDTALTVTTYASSILAVLFFLAWVVLTLLPEKKPVVVRVENKR